MDDTTRVAGNRTVGHWKKLRPRLMASLSSTDGNADSAAWDEAWNFLRERVETRYLDPIRAVRGIRRNRGEGFTVLALHCMLIEFLQSCWEGRVYEYRGRGPDAYSSSTERFEAFLTGHEPFKREFSASLAKEFYEDVRCGLLHETATKKEWKVRAHCQSERSKIVDGAEAARVLYRTAFDEAMRKFIASYELELRGGGSRDRRIALFRRFDALCGCQRTYYFAYGRNLLVDELRRRCEVFAHTERLARLPDHQLLFNKLSSKDGSGKANVEPAPGKEVWGVCYEVDEGALGRLKRKEGDGYELEDQNIMIGDPDCQRPAPVKARVFVARKEAIGAEEPSTEYRDAVLRGMRQRRLPAAYIEQVTLQLREGERRKG